MYLSFYGLKIKPFQNSTNPSFFWLGEMHKEALAIFKYGILKMPGFLVLTGDIGTGKTTLINVLTNNLGDKFIVVKVSDPGLEVIDFLNYLSDILDFQKKFTSKDTFFIHFSHFLHELSLIGKKVLLVIDECQRLSSPLLEEVIKLANIEKNEKKALKLLLVGQNEFNEVVLKNNNRALEQLISINYSIAPLNLYETGEFVKHRLKIAGAKKDIFSPDAITKIYQFSSGIPRRINIICDHSLLVGFANGTKNINGRLVRGCAEQLRPRDFSKDLDIDPQDTFVGEDFKNLKLIPPASRKKSAGKRIGITFGALILIMIPVFLISYFSDQTTYRDLINFFKTSGVQMLNTFRGADRQDLKTSLQPDIEKTLLQDRDKEDTGMIVEETVSEQIPTDMSAEKRQKDENDTPVSVVAEEDGSDVSMQVTSKPGWQDNLPDIVPIAKDLDEGDSVRTKIVSPISFDQQEAINEDFQREDQDTSDTAGVLPSGTEPDHSAAERIVKEIERENTAAPADVPQVETGITSIDDAPDSRVSDDSKTEDENISSNQKESEVNSTIAEDTRPKTLLDLPDSVVKPEKPAQTRETLDDASENVDPGAIIDWVIKNKSK